MNIKPVAMRFAGSLMAGIMLAAGIAPAANAALQHDTSTTTTGTTTSVRTNSTDDTLTITADTDLTNHTFTAVELAKIIDATAVDGKITETAVSTNSSLTNNIKSAAKTAGATDSDLTGDPMTWVAKTLTDSDTSPYAGKLRDFVTALANDSAVSKAATLPFTVSGKTAVLTGEPGVYLVFDKATGAASLPILAATTIGHLTNEAGTLGTVDWKALTAPAPEKSLTGINGKVPADPSKGVVNIGDTLTYKITQLVPATTGYSTYKLTIGDHLSKGLGEPSNLTVKVDDTVLTENTGYMTNYKAENDGSQTMFIALGDSNGNALPVLTGHKTITVTYETKVTTEARQGTYIEYMAAL